MFRTEGTEEEIMGVVQKLIPRGNFRTQTGVRFRVQEKRTEGNSRHDPKRWILFENQWFTGMYKVVVFFFPNSFLDSWICLSNMGIAKGWNNRRYFAPYAWVFVLVSYCLQKDSYCLCMRGVGIGIT